MFGKKITSTMLRTSGACRLLTLAKPLSTFSMQKSVSAARPTLISNTRFFSSDAGADSNLSQILTEEILEETSRIDEEVDEDYDEVKKFITSVFELSEKTGYGEVTLTRTYKDEKITIKFDCQDEADENDGQGQGQEEMDMDGMDGSQQHEVGDEDAEPLDGKIGIHFEATVQKKNGDKAVFSCIATHQQPTIVHINFVPASVGDSDATVYGGPRYDDLDPAVQGAFQQYLADRGVDEDLGFFVLQHSRCKEQAEYLNWLKSLNDFVN